MLRWTLLVTAMVLSQQSFAYMDAAPAPGQRDYPQYTREELQRQAQIQDEDLDFDIPQGYTKDMNAASDISEIIDKKYSDKCENFAGNGEVKSWGKIIERELDKDRYAALFKGPSDVRRLCPQYDAMNDEDKSGLWILVISAMTHFESSCVITNKAQGPNGTAAGLLQLHRGKESNYSSGCRNGDSNTAERSILCGMSMLNDQVERQGIVFSTTSYWDVLRPQGRSQKAIRIQNVIGQYPACKTGKATDGKTPLDIQPDPKGPKVPKYIPPKKSAKKRK